MPNQHSEPKRHNKESWLREMYYGRQMSLREMGEVAGVSLETILYNMEKHGIPRRSKSAAQVVKNPGAGFVQADARGYEMIKHSVGNHTYNFPVHRLLAIAEYGYEAVRDAVVHHKNGIKWDNRPSNLELLKNQSDHAAHHHEQRERDRRGRYV